MSAVTVVRFSSLGDIVLTGAVTGALGEVTFVTSSRFVELATRLPGVVDVVALQAEESVSELAARVPRQALQVDLHASVRSRALSRRVGGEWRRVARYDFRRRWRVAFKGSPAPPVVERYGRAAGVEPVHGPWIELGVLGEGTALVPGAAHATKRWPAERWVQLGRALGGPIVVFGGPSERELCASIAEGIGADAVPLTESGFSATFEALARCSRAVGSDSGLMHLAAACGLRCFTVFGSTTSDDGFWAGRCTPIELSLDCRPCSRFGGAACPVGDHYCMSELSVDHALRVVQA